MGRLVHVPWENYYIIWKCVVPLHRESETSEDSLSSTEKNISLSNKKNDHHRENINQPRKTERKINYGKQTKANSDTINRQETCVPLTNTIKQTIRSHTL